MIKEMSKPHAGSEASCNSSSITCDIEGVQLKPVCRRKDLRGEFVEVFRADWGLEIQPEQWSVVTSTARVLRGMHVHWDHDEYFMLLQGRTCVGLYDMRRDSRTFGEARLLEFDEERWTVLCFPRGIVHGWYFYEDSMHLQAVSQHYDAYHPHDNNGCKWNDPDLGIDWPDREPIISERAQKFPMLADLCQR